MNGNLDIGRKAIVGTLWLTASNYINFVISFGSGIVLARILMPSDFGMVALAVSILALFQILGAWGFDVAIIKEQEDVQRVASTLLLLRIIVSLLILVLIFIISVILRSLYAKKIITILLIIACIDTLRMISHIPSALIQKSMLLKRDAIISLLAGSISSGVAIIMAVRGFGVWSLVFLQITSSIVYFAATFLLCPYKIRPRFDKRVIKDFFNFGKYFFMGNAAEIFLEKADKIVVGTAVGSSILGLYNRGYTMSTMFEQWISPSVKRASLPALSGTKEDNIRLSKAFTLLVRGITRAVVLFYLVTGLVAAEIIVLLYGKKWLGAVPFFRLLIAYAILSAIFEIHKILHFSLGDSKTVARARIAQASFFLITMVPFLHFWGARGICVSLNIVVLIGVILLTTNVKRKLALSYFDIFGIPVVVGLVSVLVFIFLNSKIYIIGNLTRVMFYSVVLSMLFIGFSYMFEGKELKTDFQTVFTMLKRG
jgi:O-antigen/teichoic acid export membrane protein